MNHLNSSLSIRFAQHSDQGRKPENQDTVGAMIPEGSQLSLKGIAIAIADGVSSSDSAKQASQSAICGFLTDYYATPDTWRTQQSAIRVIQSLNRYLWGQSQNSVMGEGYLTTFTSLIFKGDKYFIFHVGDTRVYRMRDNVLELLTRDHTQKIDSKTTYLSRALGADSALEIDMHSEELRVDDVFILTTDGIHDSLNAHDFECTVRKHLNDPEALIKALEAEALDAGSKDNISVQVAVIDSLGTPSQADAITVLSQLPFPPILSVGNKLDGLQVEKILHESERSQVYLVKDESGTPYVMKTPSINYDDDPAYIERFVMESWIGTRIQNQHVVRIATPPESRSTLYYLTEHIAGPTLGQLIRERAPMDITDAVELVEQLAKGVRAFHRRDTLHQDIKPDNVIVGRNGAVIIDFGSCYVAGVHEVASSFERDKILGTLTYSAPEYRCGGNVGMHSDQYSIAVILYEMLTGKLPFGEAYSEASSLKDFQKLKYHPARIHNPLVPVWLDKALEKALSLQTSARYPALSEWLKDIKRPNPLWRTQQEIPLAERNPLLLWKSIAAAGWLTVLGLLLLNYRG